MEYRRRRTVNEAPNNSFRELARSLTRLRIGGVEVDPNEVTIRLGAGESADSAFPLEIEISGAALHHELREAGIDLALDDLKDFVKHDLEANPQKAMAGYLGIVKGILRNDAPRRVWRLFVKARPRVEPKWLIVRIEQVVALQDRLVLRGVAKGVTRQ